MQDFNVKGKITNFDISPDQKKIAFLSRGLLFVSDMEGKFVRELNTNPEGACGRSCMVGQRRL